MTIPDGHEQINFDTISNLTVKDGQLFWKGEKLKTETVHHVVFTKLQLLGAIVIGVAAILAPILTYVSQLQNICPNTNYSFPFCADWKARQPTPPVTINPPAPANTEQPPAAEQSRAAPQSETKNKKNARP